MAIINFNLNNSALNKAGQSNQTTVQKTENTPSNATKTSSSVTDTIALTDSAKLIQQLEEQLRQLPVVDLDKVSQVKENLNSGNYHISSERIADKFTQYESSLQNTI